MKFNDYINKTKVAILDYIIEHNSNSDVQQNLIIPYYNVNDFWSDFITDNLDSFDTTPIGEKMQNYIKKQLKEQPLAFSTIWDAMHSFYHYMLTDAIYENDEDELKVESINFDIIIDGNIFCSSDWHKICINFENTNMSNVFISNWSESGDCLQGDVEITDSDGATKEFICRVGYLIDCREINIELIPIDENGDLHYDESLNYSNDDFVFGNLTFNLTNGDTISYNPNMC